MKCNNKEAFEQQNVFGTGMPNDAYAQYQEEGKAAVSLTPGTVITIPANDKHWHGAKADSWFSHIAVEVPGEDCSNEWCEPVSDAEYHQLQD